MMTQLSSAAQRKQMKQFVKNNDPSALLQFIANFLDPLTAQECNEINPDSANYLQKCLLWLTAKPEYFVEASSLLGKIYLDEESEDSKEGDYKRLFTQDSSIELETKKAVFSQLIHSQYDGAVDLAFCILDILIPGEDQAYYKDFLAIVLQAMKNPQKHNALLHRVKSLLGFMLIQLKMPLDEILGAMLIQLGHSEELLLLFKRMEENNVSLNGVLLAHDANNQSIQWTAIAMTIFTDCIPILPAKYAVALLSKIAAVVAAQHVTLDNQIQLFTALNGLDKAVTDWADFNLDNASPPVSPNSYMSTLPLTPRWKNNRWEPTALHYKASYLEHSLVFKEAIGSYHDFCPFAALGTSRLAVIDEIDRLTAVVKCKLELYILLKTQIARLVAKNPAENSLWHPKDIKKLATFNMTLRSVGQEYSVYFDKKKRLTSYVNTSSESDQKNNAQAIMQYAQLVGVKVCFWQSATADNGKLVLLAQPHDNFLDVNTRHFILKDNHLNALHRADAKHHIDRVLQRVALGK